jgi:hypothetical protein
MPIHPSSAADVGRLIEELSHSSALRRETAAARLAVIGPRAVTRLTSLAADEEAVSRARIAALRALEAMGDTRAWAVASKLGELEHEIGAAAIAVVGAVARSGEARAAQAFEWLAALAMNTQASDTRRLAALTALEAGPARHVRPIYAALTRDPSERVAAHALRGGAGETEPLETAIGRLPDDPGVVSAMIREDADSTNVSDLRKLIEAIHERERAAAPESRGAWIAARGQVHQVLASRGSRLGVYDLRETLAAAQGPLPVGFLAAAAASGDASCLEPLAAAWIAASPKDVWWREHLAEAFRAIVKRESLARRHPELRRILERHPSAGALVGLAR